MILKEKERTTIEDLQTQEKSCIEKYGRYAQQAKDPELKNLISAKILYIFSQNHLDQVFIQHDRAVPGIKDHTFDFICSKCGFK